MKALRRVALSMFALLAFASFAGGQTSGSLNTQASQIWNTAPWSITSGPGTFPTGGGVATFLPQLNTELGVSPDLTSISITNAITLSGLDFEGPFRWRIQTSGGSLALSATGAMVDADLPDFGQRYVIASSMSGGGAVGLTKVGQGTLTLSAANTYTGGTHINNGALEITTGDGVLGATGTGNGVSIDGGTLRLSGASVTTSRPLAVGAGDGAIDSLVTSPATFNGVIGGTGDLSVATSSEAITFTADNTLSGALSLFARSIPINLNGANGAFRFASAYNFFGVLANLDSASANNSDRLSDTATITAGNNAAIFLVGNSAVSTTENVGPLNVAGTTRIVINANSGQQPSLNFASINRQNNAPLFIAGSNLGAAPGPFVAQLTSVTAPVPLIGGSGAPGSTVISILPWMTGKDTTAGQFNGMRHVTYDPVTDRLRGLSTAEYADAFGGAATNNVRLTTATAAPTNTTVNALLFAPPSPATISGGPINVTSGSFIHSPTSFFFPDFSTVSAGLNFGATEGIIHATSNLEISGAITGSGGLTISPRGFTVRLSGANTYTGPTNIFEGVVEVSDEVGSRASTSTTLRTEAEAPNGGDPPTSFGSSQEINLYGGATVVTTPGGNFILRDNTTCNIVASLLCPRRRDDPPTATVDIQPGGTLEIDGQIAVGENAALSLTGGSTASPVEVTGDGNITGPGVIQIPANAFYNFSRANDMGGLQILGTLQIGLGDAVGDGPVEVANGGSLGTNGDPVTIDNPLSFSGNANFFFRPESEGSAPASITGSASLTFTGPVDLRGKRTLSVSSTEPVFFSGLVSHGSLTKQGTGTLVLNRAAGNDYTGGTTVSAGTLLVNNSSGSATGAGTNFVTAGGSLGGNFTISDTAQIEGTLKPGSPIGTANFGDDLFLTDTAQTDLEFSGASSTDKVSVAGLLTLDGTIRILTTGYVAQPGDRFDLFDWGTLDASNFNPGTDIDFSGAPIAAGASWDAADFLNDGSILVVSTALNATGAVSRKTHGAAGTFKINLPFSGEPGVECRSSGGNHTLIISFSRRVVSGTASVTSGAGSVTGSPTFAANQMTVNLTGVTDGQKITVTLSNVTDDTAQVLPSTAFSVNMLIGDANGNKTVNASDIGQTKSQSGQAVSAANFRADVTVNGTINASDIGLVKSRSGATLP